MKKLGKNTSIVTNTIEAYSDCSSKCKCSCISLFGFSLQTNTSANAFSTVGLYV